MIIRNRTRRVLLLLTLVVLLCATAAHADADTKSSITGVNGSITENYKHTASDTVTISPASGRPVELYLYDEDNRQWLLKKTFLTSNDQQSKVTIKYPDNWKAHSYVALCSVADRALTHRLEVNPNLRKVFLCLDNDEAGQTAAERMKESMSARG